MPPVLPAVLAALRWVTGDDTEAVTALVVLLQDLTLIGTGVLVLALALRTTGQVKTVTVLFVAALAYYFRLCFQFTHDCWIVLAALDLLVAGLVWVRPFESSRGMAAAWGAFGGLCALVSPVVGFTWGVLALAAGLRRGRRSRLAIAALVSVLTISPWVVRNYLLFGRLIPVKSNLAYELFQSQCLTPDGILQGNVFGSHPYVADNEERWEYRKVGEMAYLDGKRDLFLKALRDDPLDFAERVVHRFVAATLVYVPFNRQEEARRPWVFWLSRLVHPLPFLALLALLAAAPWRPLSAAQWVVVGVYLAYLLPYVFVSYYDRYKFPLIGAEVLLMAWAIAWRPGEPDDVVVLDPEPETAE
jgi:hypothetical protein